MDKKLMMIINPIAGKGQHRASIFDTLESFCNNGYAVTVYVTGHAGHARELSRAHAAEYDLVVCFGGDGTLSETIAGLMDADDRPPLGYIPTGTANDVAATLGLPAGDTAQAAEIILNGHTIPFDVGRMNGDYFTYISAFGAFTEVSYRTPQASKQTLGHLAYVLEGVGHLGKIVPRQIKVTHDGGTVEGEFIFGAVTNTTSIAGLVKLKSDLVAIGDGFFEVLLVKNPRNFGELNRIIMGILTQNYDPDYVQIIKSKRVTFTFEDEDVQWTRDGEDGGAHKEVFLENIEAPIQFIVPTEGWA